MIKEIITETSNIAPIANLNNSSTSSSSNCSYNYNNNSSTNLNDSELNKRLKMNSKKRKRVVNMIVRNVGNPIQHGIVVKKKKLFFI